MTGTRGIAVGGVATVLFVGVHVAAAFAGGTWWGLHHFRYLEPGSIVLVAIGATACAALVVPREGRSASTRRRPVLVDLLVAVGITAVFWLMRDRSHLLGDGSLILAASADVAPDFHPREPLSHLIAHALHVVAAATGAETSLVFGGVSCLAGGLAAFALGRLDRTLGAGGLVLALSLLHGAVQLFCGYIEHYPFVACVVVAWLVALRAPFTRPASVFPATLLALFALALHVSAFILLPATVGAWIVQGRRRGGRSGVARVATEAVGALVLLVAGWELLFRNVTGALSFPRYLGILGRARVYSWSGEEAAGEVEVAPLLSASHFHDWFQLILLLVPVALPVAAAALLRVAPRAREHLWEIALAVTAAGTLVAQLVFYPNLGAPRDWDVLAAGAFPLAVVGAAMLLRAWPAPATRIAPWLVGLAALHTLPWILVNAQPEAARARYEELPISRGQHAFVLGARSLRDGHPDTAVMHFLTATEVAPGSVHAWMSLGIALSQVGRPVEALAAYDRALLCEPDDHRVSRADVLERIAEAALRAGATDRAERAWHEAIAERPMSVPARVGLATLALARGDPEAALACLEPIRSRRDETPAIFGITWQALRALGRRDEADAALQEGRALFPDDPVLRSAASSP